MLTTLKDQINLFSQHFSGPASKRYIENIICYHRIQASAGFRGAANLCLKFFKYFGLPSEIISFKADLESKYWALSGFEEWKIKGAWLKIIEPKGEERKLADFNDNKFSVIQRSAPFKGEVEVVCVQDGEKEEDYRDLDVKGKVVLTRGRLFRVYQLAVQRRGAVGIIYDNISRLKGVRDRLSLPDALQYASFWWEKGVKKCFGFVISPREGERLRALLQDKRQPLKVQVEVNSEFSPGNFEIVSALIKGETDEEVVLTAHLCHPQWSANDNASGCGVILECAKTLQRLISEGSLPRPKRSIRFLLVPETTGTVAYLANKKPEPKIVACLNLDMVGEKQNLCESILLIISSPHANPSFTDILTQRIVEEISKTTEPLLHYNIVPFSGGSDHEIFADPLIGIPTTMLNQWPDRFYHTSEDTIDKVSSSMLRKIGTISCTFAYFIANAQTKELKWLAKEITLESKKNLLSFISKWETEWMDKSPKEIEPNKWKEKIEHLVSKEQQTFSSLEKINPIDTKPYQEEIKSFADSQFNILQKKIGEKREPAEIEKDKWTKLSTLITPKRIHPGPLDTSLKFKNIPPKEQDEFYALFKEYEDEFYTTLKLALFWCDGKRSLLDIIKLVELETGIYNPELIVRYFQLLERIKLINF